MSEPVYTDFQARQIVESAKRSEQEIPVLELLGGDLAKTLGGGRGVPSGKNLVCDLGSVLIDGQLYWFISHLLAGKFRFRKDKTRWRGDFFLAMNSAWLGSLNLATRAHPGDGKLDILSGKLKFAEGREFARRAKSGTHLPNANLSYKQAAAVTHSFQNPRPVYLDGVFVDNAENLAVRIEPQALNAII